MREDCYLGGDAFQAARAKSGRSWPGPAGLAAITLAAGFILGFGLLFISRLIDFPVYYAAGRSLISGRTDLYAADFARGPVMDYRYPPFFLVALAPLWRLPYNVAAYLWYLVGICSIAGCVYALKDAAPGLGGVRPQSETTQPDGSRNSREGGNSGKGWAIWAVGLCVAGPYFVMNLHYGNAQLPVTALLFVSLYLAMLGKQTASAALLALSIAIKITPALVLPYFALKRQWKMLALTLAFVAGISLAPGAYYGFGKNIELLRTWFQHVIVSQEFHEANGPVNLSLKGELSRYLTRVDYSSRVDGDTHYPEVNFINLPGPSVIVIWRVLDVIVILGGLGLILIRGWSKSTAANSNAPATAEVRQSYESEIGTQQADGQASLISSRSSRSEIDALELAFVLCLLLLAEPLTSKIYFTALLWPVVRLAQLARRTNSQQSKVLWRLLFGASAVNITLALLPGRSVQRLLLVVGTDFYLTCFLAGLLVYAMISVAPAGPAASGESQMRGPQTAKAPSTPLHRQN
jgi:hypothetical protein